jgi:hypothetical protein
VGIEKDSELMYQIVLGMSNQLFQKADLGKTRGDLDF